MRNLIRLMFLFVSASAGLLAQDGALDTSFDTTGIAYTPFQAGSYDEANAVAIQADGRIVIGGKSGNNFALTRYWSNGLLDTTFGTGGKVTTDLGGGDEVRALAIQTNGKIVAVGIGYLGEMGIARYDTSGALDVTFGYSGTQMFYAGQYCYGYGVALQSDGKIVAAGYVRQYGAPDDFIVCRLNTDGSPDGTFGSSGVVTTDFVGGDDEGYAVAIQPDGKIIVAGSNYYSSFALVRYKTNGVVDSTFGTNGRVSTTVGPGYSAARGVAIQADGKIVVAGSSSYNASNFTVVRYNSSGVVDSTFGTNGVSYTWFGYGVDDATSVALQLDGKILVAGTVTNVYGEYDVGVVRFNSNGALDNTFGSGGMVHTELGSILDYGNGMAIQSNGRIVIAAKSLNPTGRYSFAAVRYLGSSAPLPVELKSFSASVKGNSVEMTWKTATESNSYGFAVERTSSGSRLVAESWTTIGFVSATGTSNAPKEYSYTDNGVSSGRFAYRIKQIDKDGSFKYTQTTEVEVGSAPKAFTLSQNYPNPFNPTTTIEFSVPEDGRAVLKIVDMLGRDVATLFEGEAKSGFYQRIVFDASKLASGVYFSRLESGGKQQLKKMLLMK